MRMITCECCDAPARGVLGLGVVFGGKRELSLTVGAALCQGCVDGVDPGVFMADAGIRGRFRGEGRKRGLGSPDYGTARCFLIPMTDSRASSMLGGGFVQ